MPKKTSKNAGKKFRGRWRERGVDENAKRVHHRPHAHSHAHPLMEMKVPTPLSGIVSSISSCIRDIHLLSANPCQEEDQ